MSCGIKALRAKIWAMRAICCVALRDVKARMFAIGLVTARTVSRWQKECVVVLDGGWEIDRERGRHSSLRWYLRLPAL